jgi:SAM-dependent methyltransferase
MSDWRRDLPADAFDKDDAGDDLAFYAPPRLVSHIDDAAIAALGAYYARIIPANAVVLDLMSSWISHLPAGLEPASVIGHGMNAVELAANTRLDRWFVADLNAAPALPLDSASIDVALCCVGVQYLQQPVPVFAEVRRALRPGGRFAVSYSNRCFPTKAVRIWRLLDMAGQARLIRLYLERAGFDTVNTSVLADGSQGDPLVVVTGTIAA